MIFQACSSDDGQNLLELVYCELSPDSTIVENVLTNFFVYDAIEIRGSIFYSHDWTPEIASKFWNMLSKTVKEITVYEFQEEFSSESDECSCKNYLCKLKELIEIKCHWAYLKLFISDDFLNENKNLQEVKTHFYFPGQRNVFMIADSYPIQGDNFGDFYISEEIVKILSNCRALKEIRLPCSFTQQNTVCSINEAASILNSMFLNFDKAFLQETIFPDKVSEFCKITGIRIEINESLRALTLNIISLELNPHKISHNIENTSRSEENVICHENDETSYLNVESLIDDSTELLCFFDHKPHFNSQVKNLTINLGNFKNCDQCWDSFFLSFPNIRNIYSKNILNSSILHKIAKHLRNLKTLKLQYEDPFKDWPSIPSLQSLSVRIFTKSSFLDHNNYFCQSCPNMKSLCVELGKQSALALTYKEFVQNLGEKWKEIIELKIDEAIRINGQDLAAIEHNLGELKMLNIGCNETEHRILQLFIHLPRLELIVYRNANRIKKVLTRNYFNRIYKERIQYKSYRHLVQSSISNIEASWSSDLPPEIWVLIFKKLTYNDQLSCRMVCNLWRDILSSSIEFYQNRHLTLQNCVLGLDMEPMETFCNTTFNYGILRLGINLNIIDYRAAMDFFRKLGKHIKEIQILLKSNVFELLDLFENGLNLENLPNLKTLYVEKSSSFESLLKDSQQFKKIVDEKLIALRFDSLKLEDIASWPPLAKITSLKMNVLYSFDDSFIYQNWPAINKLSIGFMDGRFNGRLILFRMQQILKRITILEVGYLLIDDKILDLIKTHCIKLKILRIRASNIKIKSQTLERDAKMFFKELNDLKEISFAELSVKDQKVSSNNCITFSRKPSLSNELDKTLNAKCCLFFKREFDVKLLKLKDTDETSNEVTNKLKDF